MGQLSSRLFSATVCIAKILSAIQYPKKTVSPKKVVVGNDTYIVHFVHIKLFIYHYVHLLNSNLIVHILLFTLFVITLMLVTYIKTFIRFHLLLLLDIICIIIITYKLFCSGKINLPTKYVTVNYTLKRTNLNYSTLVSG